MKIKEKDLIEKLADYEHQSWARWMIHLFSVSKENNNGTYTIPKDKVDRWQRQSITPYNKLSEDEKESDRKEVRRIIKILK